MTEEGLPYLTKEDKQQVDYIESLLANLTAENMDKVVRKLKNLTFKTRRQLQHFSDLVFKYALQRPDKIRQYACVCEELKEAKVTILIFDKMEDKESLEIANLRFHILLKTRAEMLFDQIGALKDNYDLFFREIQNNALTHVYAMVRNQIFLAGELYKHELVMPDFIFAMINRLASMVGLSEFFLECLVSLLELTAKGLEAKSFNLGKYFKQIKKVATNNSAASELVDRIKNLLRLKRSKWLGGEEEVPPEQVDNLLIDENLKQRSLKGIEEELGKYISSDRCRSCCVEFEASGRITHLISKQHTSSIQTLLRDQYQGNLLSGRVKACVICQETIEKIFIHFSAPKHKINTTTFCFICQTKFKSAFFLSKHLRSLSHRKVLIKMYDSILKTKVLEEIIAKENDILGEDSFDEADDTVNDDEEFNRLLNENAALRENIFKYLDLLTSDNTNVDEEKMHERIIEELDKFVENICISNNTSTKETVVLLRQFNQEAEDVKATIKCAKGELPLLDNEAKETSLHSSSLVDLLKDQYAELCEDVKVKVKKLKKLKKVKPKVEVQETIEEPSGQDIDKRSTDQEAVGESDSAISVDEEYTNKISPQSLQEDNLKSFVDEEHISTILPRSLQEDLRKENNLNSFVDKEHTSTILPQSLQEDPRREDNLQYFVDKEPTSIFLSESLQEDQKEDNLQYFVNIEHTSTTLPHALQDDIHKDNLQSFVDVNKHMVCNKDTALTCAINNLKELTLENEDKIIHVSKKLSGNSLNNREDDTDVKVLTVFNIRGVNIQVTEVEQDLEEKNLPTTSGITNTNFKGEKTQGNKKTKGESSKKGVQIPSQTFVKSCESKNKGKKQYKNKKNVSNKGAIPKIKDIEKFKNDTAESSSQQREQPLVNATSVDQNSQVSTAQIANASTKVQKDQEVNGVRFFNLKRIKLRTFARIKRKLTEKLRSTENTDKWTDEILNDVTNLIRKCYTSDDISLEASLRLFQSFNAKLNSEPESTDIADILKELDKIFKI